MADALCKGVLVGAASSSFAGLFTNPIDVVKTEMQVASTTHGLLPGSISDMKLFSRQGLRHKLLFQFVCCNDLFKSFGNRF